MLLVKSLILLAVVIKVLALDGNSNIDDTKFIHKPSIASFWNIKVLKPQNIFYNGNGRIVGGNEAVPNSYPHQAALLIRFQLVTGLCGGTVITATHVLTAAHCLEFSINTQVIMGVHNIFTVEETQARTIVERSNYIVHENYDPQLLYNDIALLFLTKAVTFNEYIQPIQLPTFDLMDDRFTGEIATVSGKKVTTGNDLNLIFFRRLRLGENKRSEQCCFSCFTIHHK